MMRFVHVLFTASVVFSPWVEGSQISPERSNVVSDETTLLQAAASAKSAAAVAGAEDSKACSCTGIGDVCLEPQSLSDVSMDGDLEPLDVSVVFESAALASLELREDDPDPQFVFAVRQIIWLLTFALASKGAMNCRRPQEAPRLARGPTGAHESADESAPNVGAALRDAALAGDAARCEALIRQAPDAAATPDAWGTTALHAGATEGSKDVAELLLDRGAPVDPADSWDETPLHVAARGGYVAVCELLVRNGASLRARNAEDQTPLVVAGYAEEDEVCKALLAFGADADGVPDADVPEFLREFMAR